MNLPRLALLLAALSLLAGAPGRALAAVPGYIQYDGMLLDDQGAPISELRTFTFTIYDAETGGTALFKDSQANTPVAGVFRATLGIQPGNPLSPEISDGRDLWLEVKVQKPGSQAVTLTPRLRLARNPMVAMAREASKGKDTLDALSIDGVPAASLISEDALQGNYLTSDNFGQLMTTLGYLPGEEYSDARLQQYLDATGVVPHPNYTNAALNTYLGNAGYEPGPYFSGNYADLQGKPDLTPYATVDALAGKAKDTDLVPLVTSDATIDQLKAAGIFLLADGTVALTGSLDMANHQIVRAVVHRTAASAAPASPKKGQLWYNVTNNSLNLYTTSGWRTLGAVDATDIQCNKCVSPDNLAFGFATSVAAGGVANQASNILCDGCIGTKELNVSYAEGEFPGGPALASQDLNCVGCLATAQLDPIDFGAQSVEFDATKSGLSAATMQEALDQMALVGPGGIQEGNGATMAYSGDWLARASSTQTQFVHLFNPGTPKVITYLYGLDSPSTTAASDATIAGDTGLSQYGYNVTGTAGQTTLNVGASVGNIKANDHILIYQIVGTNTTATNAGNFELNQVKSISGNTLTLYRALKNSYYDNGPTNGQAQVVVAASYKKLTLNSGANLHPSSYLTTDGEYGGVIYVRAEEIVMNSGAVIQADGYGYDSYDSTTYKGDSECRTDQVADRPANCSGGGGGCCQSYCGGGGGGNKTAGKDSSLTNCDVSYNGKGGSAKGNDTPTILTMGGAGGASQQSYNSSYQGNGGGLVVIGAKKVTVNSGARISANGNAAQNAYCGGGAGGSVAVFAATLTSSGTVQAIGGLGHKSGSYYGGDGGDGWVHLKTPITGAMDSAVPKSVSIKIDGADFTAKLGDPNSKGSPNWDSSLTKWGKDGVTSWSSGPLDLSSLITWSLGEHKLEFVEAGGIGGRLKAYTYVIYPFSKASAPANNTCTAPQELDVMSGSVAVSGTTEDTMGKIRATDNNSQPGCGGSGGPDTVYKFTLTDWKHLAINTTAPFTPRVYIRKDDCQTGQAMGCGSAAMSADLKSGTYYLFMDSDDAAQRGNYNLAITATAPSPPSNDTCALPTVLSFDASGVAEAYGVTLFSTNAFTACNGEQGLDNVFQFTIPEGTTKVTFDITTDFNPIMAIKKGTCTAAPFSCAPTKHFEMSYQSSGVYYVVVDGKTAADKGEYTLKITLTK